MVLTSENIHDIMITMKGDKGKVNYEKVGLELKALRVKNGLTQIELAEKIGVHQNTIMKYEKNANDIQLSVLEKILELFNVELYIFFKNVSENIHK